MTISRQLAGILFSCIFAFFALTVALPSFAAIQANVDDDIYPAAKIDKPAITSLKITPTEFKANEKNPLKIILKFSDKKANLQGGRLTLAITEDNGFVHNFSFELKHKKFAKEKGRYKFKTDVVLGNCKEVNVAAQLQDSAKLKSKTKKMTMAVNSADDGGGGGGGDTKWGTKVGEKAVNFSLLDQQGNQVSLHDYKGKVILLDFSTMWCGPCKSEAAHAEELYQKFKDRGFIMLTVLFQDYSGNSISTEDCKTWSETYGLSIPVLADINLEIWNQYDDEGYIPLNLVIDKDLVIQYKQTSFNPTAIEQMIEKLLGS